MVKEFQNIEYNDFVHEHCIYEIIGNGFKISVKHYKHILWVNPPWLPVGLIRPTCREILIGIGGIEELKIYIHIYLKRIKTVM